MDGAGKYRPCVGCGRTATVFRRALGALVLLVWALDPMVYCQNLAD